MQLIEAIRYTNNDVVVFVGAGGKTTAMFKVAKELSTNQEHEKPLKSVLVTTTTHLGVWQSGLADQVIRIHNQFDTIKLEKDLPVGVTLLIGEENENRLSGLPYKLFENIHRIAKNHNTPLLIEADGSGSRPLKAPAKHEPAIPAFANNVVVIAGLSGFGKPITRDWVHRPELFAELSEMNLGDRITIDGIVNVLRKKDGGLKNIPSTSRRTLLLNQADTIERQSQGKEIADKLITDYHSIIIASLQKEKGIDNSGLDKKPADGEKIHAVIEQIAAIILAAGGSSRYGEPKQLLIWNGQPIIRHVVNTAMKAELDPIVVVVGSSEQEVVNVISDLPVRIVSNPDWKTGLSSSIRKGMTELPKEVGGVIFLQTDKPQISHILLKSLIEVHQETLSPIIAPEINGQRGSPVLFDRKTFPDLLTLQGDVGGRALFSRHYIRSVIWNDPNLLMDIDTPEDYKKFLEIFNNEMEKK